MVLLGDELEVALARDHSPVTAAALLVLEKYPAASVEALRRPLALSHSGGVRVVDRLVAEGYVERRAATDARAVALYLTRKGRDAAAVVRAQREATLLRAVGTLTAAEQETLGRLATKLLDRNVLAPAAAMRACRLCDYDACTECPMHKFASDDHGGP